MPRISLVDVAFDIVERAPWIARAIQRMPAVARPLNRWIIGSAASATPHRPLPYSLWSAADPADARTGTGCGAYTAWPGLVDRSYTGRHLPPVAEEEVAALPSAAALALLFRRVRFDASPKTTVFFCLFAQWFTDSFMRTHPDDRRKNTSNHEVDLCQIYGLGEHSTRMLRARHDGLLKSRLVKGAEYPALLADPKTLLVKPEFEGIAYDPISATTFDDRRPPHGTARELRATIRSFAPWAVTDERWRHHYAAGLERANSTLVYSALNTVFLREHNRLARALRAAYPRWSDDQLFETARNINIVLLLKVIMEDYVNHIAATPIRITLEQGYADRCRWYRANRVALEFNLLYRWHSMVPDHFRLAGRRLADSDFRYNNALLEEAGVERVIDAASRQPAGRIALHNTPDFLVEADLASIRLGRQFRLKGFNDYRERWGLYRYDSIEELTGGDLALAAELKALYPDRAAAKGVDRVELFVGLLAEQRRKSAVLPPLLKSMVASDAFSHALTNPLLATYVYGKDCFTEVGTDTIERTSLLRDIVWRNLPAGVEAPSVAFTLASAV